MQASEIIQPLAISQPVAVSGIKNTIPENATGSNLASIQEGFPQKTMISPQDGGEPPYGQDFNGLFYLSTDQRVYTQNGGIITFNQDVSNAIGGYPQGAILDYYVSATQSFSKVVSLIDNNTNNFVTTPSYIDGVNWELLNFGGANIDLSNLSPTGQAILDSKLDQTQVTNCILEIPQDINIELSDGVLTLKAGSVVYVPNGLNTFKKLTISNNLSMSLIAGSTDYLVFVSENGLTLQNRVVKSSLSGSSDPNTGGTTYYNTTNNKIISHNTTGDVQVSFPIARITVSNSVITSISQVFNGIGYIGKTLFALPNVKGLIPNGRNTDGTLKNTELNLSNPITFTRTDEITGSYGLSISPSSINASSAEYNYTKNLNILPSSGAINNGILIGSVTHTNGNVTSIKVDEPFTAVDYNDFYELQNNSANKDLSNLTNGLANVICTTAPTKTSSASAQKPAVVVENYVSGFYSRQIFSDKTCVQTGILTNVSNGDVYELPTEYANTNFKVFLQPSSGTNSTTPFNYITIPQNKTTHSFGIYTNASDNNTFGSIEWLAIGYIN